MKTKLIIIAAIVLLSCSTHGQVSAPPAKPAAPAKPTTPAIELLPTEVDAVGWAFSALIQYAENDPSVLPYLRFVWLPPFADAEWIGVMNFAVNASCSQTTVLVKADIHAGGFLLAYNLQRLAPDPVQCARLIETWDSLAERESRLHVPKDNLVDTVQEVTVTDPRTRQPVKQKKTVQVKKRIFVLAPHLEAALARHVTEPEKSQRLDVLITQLTRSTGGIYPADFLLEQLLTSVRGKYPEFRQIDFKVEKGTPIQSLFDKRGFFLEESIERLGDKGCLLLQSDVTGKTRIVLCLSGLTGGGRPTVITFDFKDSRTRPDEQFIRNLVEFVAFSDANEIFIPLTNGLLEYVLTDAKGNILRSAPPDIVVDSTKPDGHTKELEMGMSCVVCHSPDDGYKTKRNDMELLLGSDVDYFGDEFSFTRRGKKVTLNKQQAEAVVVGRYGEPIYLGDGILGRARRDFVKAVSYLTDYPVIADGPSPVQRLGQKVKEIYHSQRYPTSSVRAGSDKEGKPVFATHGGISADGVCLRLGVRVPEGQGTAVLRKLVPALPKGSGEDLLIGLMRNGALIKPDDYDPLHVDLMRRALPNRTLFAGENN